jgi:hypothetical protein
MTKPTKTLFILGASGLILGVILVAGIIPVHDAPSLFVVLPTGAILFGIFLISLILEKETALYDRQQSENLVDWKNTVRAEAPHRSQSTKTEPSRKPALATH